MNHLFNQPAEDLAQSIVRAKNPFLVPVLLAIFGSVLAGQVPAQTFTTLYNFSATDPTTGTNSDGAQINGPLILSSNTLYGTAQVGGSSGLGTVFKLNTDGTGFTTLYNFSATAVLLDTGGTNSDGAVPREGLVLSGKTLYGAASGGGNYGHGTVFKVNTDGTDFAVLYTFPPGGPQADYPGPFSGLVSAGNALYGTTFEGGSSGNGTVFGINTDGTGFTNLCSFDAHSGEGFCCPRILVLSEGTLYGVGNGGAGDGTVFRLNTDGSFLALHSFTATSATNRDGAFPMALAVSATKVYGSTQVGGLHGAGTLFAVNIDGTDFKVLRSFTGAADGANANALIPSGNLLYWTSGGGSLFSMRTDGTAFTTLYHSGSGLGLQAGVISSNNILYGTTWAWGSGTSGANTVFSFVIPPQLTVTPAGANVILSWPTNFTGYTLQRSIDLGSAGWTTYNLQAPPIISNGEFMVTIPNTTGTQQFFRLSQ